MTDHERDEHLLAALRHAPDRDVAPPAALSEAILRQARGAVDGAPAPNPVHPEPVLRQARDERNRTVRPEPVEGQGGARASTSSARTGGWWMGLKDGFNSLLRPAPAAAFGTLAVAGIVGLMWANQEPPGVADEVPLVAVPSSPLKSAPDAASAPVAAPAPAPAAEMAAVAPKPPTPPTAAIAKAAPPKAKAPVAQVAAPRPTLAEAAAPVTMPSTTRPAEPAAAVADSAAAAPAPAPTSPPAAPAPARAAPSMESAAPAGMRADAADAVRSAAAPALKSSTAEAAAAPAARQRSMADTSALQLAGSSGGSPLVSVLALLNTAGSDAQWTSPQGKLLAHSAAQQQWLADISRSTAGAWQRVSGGAASSPGGVPWTLRQRVSAVGSLWLEGATLWWRDARGALFTAQVSEDQVRAWIDATKDW